VSGMVPFAVGASVFAEHVEFSVNQALPYVAGLIALLLAGSILVRMLLKQLKRSAK